jgi:hypothetical protein
MTGEFDSADHPLSEPAPFIRLARRRVGFLSRRFLSRQFPSRATDNQSQGVNEFTHILAQQA